MSIETARQQAADTFPEGVQDTLGRVHENIPRRSVLSGAWDNGSLVQSFVTALEGVAEVGRGQ